MSRAGRRGRGRGARAPVQRTGWTGLFSSGDGRSNWAAPQPMGQCTTSSGTVLAVDFSHWGGPIYRS
ncbi:hypothetical protein AB0B51_21315, partial [Streptomyces griseus]